MFINTNVSLVDIADCVEGHLLAAERGAAGERYLLSGIRLTVAEALALAGDVAGVERHPRFVPRAAATTAGTIVEWLFRLRRRKPPVCREMVRTLLHGHLYDGSRAERELGVPLHRAARDGAAHGGVGALRGPAEKRLGHVSGSSARTRRYGAASLPPV